MRYFILICLILPVTLFSTKDSINPDYFCTGHDDTVLITSKTFASSSVATLENIRGGNNKRAYPNQDRAFIIPLFQGTAVDHNCLVMGVFDGHGKQGDRVSCAARALLEHYINNNFESHSTELPYKVIPTIAESIQQDVAHFAQKAGTTACFALVRKQPTGYQAVIANVGDSRALIMRKGKVIFSTHDHKPSDTKEFKRITKNGGWVEKNYIRCPETSGGLALSRSWGDVLFHTNNIVSVTPDITTFGIHENDMSLQEGDIIICATDGLWDCMTHEEVALLSSTNSVPFSKIADLLTKKARAQGSKDDITAIVAQLS